MKPPTPYYGGKQRIAKKIIALMPEHQHYVEPFFGGGSILMAKEPVRHETINDLDGRIVNFWRVIRDRPADLERAVALTPHARDEQLASYDVADDEIEDARRVFVMLTQGRNAKMSKSGWRNILDPKNTMSFSAYITGYLARIAPAAERMLNVSIESRDAIEVINTYGRYEDTLLYVDPPYIGSTRNSVGYALEATDPEFHEHLLEALLRCKASVVLSGYASAIYEDALGDWRRVEIDARANTRGRTEVLWINRHDLQERIAA